ncbi:MAG: electron transport complex subunit RsxG [Methylotenera sp. 24-45-7]|jgi:electron transport complex protein RnfG|nr:MAG: electron transport complex subunit RsxG [Methylotenera sp. 24-45-7]OZA53575.1 MAG: electron transport complex subunit RsxG [Methylophilales bacterium 39-45-7]HQS37387.1 electron transport complex subunit RsxG [Methylotenera sp.]HQS44316.1 electron transport complex subunit RsxG [Methylotenera sp.]
MPETLIKHALKTAATLTAFALVGTALLSYIFAITRAPIEASEAEAKLALFKQIMPQENFDNDILKHVVQVAPSPLLGNRAATQANIAMLNNQVAGVILEAVAHDGYSGDIKLLIAYRADGAISGVRVLSHKETPGLGDYIDIAHGDWIKAFDNESLAKTPAQQWQVKKDGGKFDYMAGATITPRAVVKAVLKATQYFEENKQSLLAENIATNTKQQK